MGLVVNLVYRHTDRLSPRRPVSVAMQHVVTTCREHDLSREIDTLLAQNHLGRHGTVIQNAFDFLKSYRGNAKERMHC
jgi:hypothetical protein